MATISSEEREAQRVAHLVLGKPRPAPPAVVAPRKPNGVSKQEWKPLKAQWLRAERIRVAAEAVLADDIEPHVALAEKWSHKTQGTPATHEHAEIEARREGALARLHATGAIDAHQLAAAEEIATAHAAITADVAVRTAKLERTSPGRHDPAEERIGSVLRDRAYSAWRAAVAPHAAMLLAIVIDDVGLVAAARRWRMSNRRARSILVAALDSWRRC